MRRLVALDGEQILWLRPSRYLASARWVSSDRGLPAQRLGDGADLGVPHADFFLTPGSWYRGRRCRAHDAIGRWRRGWSCRRWPARCRRHGPRATTAGAASSCAGSTRRLRIAERLGGRCWPSRRRTRKRCSTLGLRSSTHSRSPCSRACRRASRRWPPAPWAAHGAGLAGGGDRQCPGRTRGGIARAALSVILGTPCRRRGSRWAARNRARAPRTGDEGTQASGARARCSCARRGRSRGCVLPRSSWRPVAVPRKYAGSTKVSVAEAGRPVVHQTARAQREHPRAEVALTADELLVTRCRRPWTP